LNHGPSSWHDRFRLQVTPLNAAMQSTSPNMLAVTNTLPQTRHGIAITRHCAASDLFKQVADPPPARRRAAGRDGQADARRDHAAHQLRRRITAGRAVVALGNDRIGLVGIDPAHCGLPRFQAQRAALNMVARGVTRAHEAALGEFTTSGRLMRGCDTQTFQTSAHCVRPATESSTLR